MVLQDTWPWLRLEFYWRAQGGCKAEAAPGNLRPHMQDPSS